MNRKDIVAGLMALSNNPEKGHRIDKGIVDLVARRLGESTDDIELTVDVKPRVITVREKPKPWLIPVLVVMGLLIIEGRLDLVPLLWSLATGN